MEKPLHIINNVSNYLDLTSIWGQNCCWVKNSCWIKNYWGYKIVWLKMKINQKKIEMNKK